MWPEDTLDNPVDYIAPVIPHHAELREVMLILWSQKGQDPNRRHTTFREILPQHRQGMESEQRILDIQTYLFFFGRDTVPV